MNCCFSRCSLIVLFSCFVCLSAGAAEYCLRPDRGDATQATSVVCCTTPTGWQGWKDDPHYWDGVEGFTRMWLQTAHIFSVSFSHPNCKVGPKCAFLDLKTTGRDARGQPDVETGLRDFLGQLEQLQDLSPRKPPCVVVNRFGTFHTANSGVLTIWRIRCPSGNQGLVTLFAQRDVLVIIHLRAPSSTDIAAEVEGLKKLARSVRITDATLTSPDVIKIDADSPDRTIKDQLLQLTPLGTPREKVYQLLECHLFKDTWDMTSSAKLHWTENGQLYTEIGRYSSAVSRRKRSPKEFRPPTAEEIRRHISTPPTLPPAIVVRAFWKFDKARKLRDIEVQRQVVEYKSKRALSVKQKGR